MQITNTQYILPLLFLFIRLFFPRGKPILRWFLCPVAVRHRALYSGGEPDGDHRERADDGRLPAELVLLGGLSDGSEHRGPQVPEPCAGPCGMDDSGGRHGLLDPKLRRGRGTAGQDDRHGSHGWNHAIILTSINIYENGSTKENGKVEPGRAVPELCPQAYA